MEIFCSLCGISSKIRNVSEAISSKWIILACDKCALEEGFPILKKPKIELENGKRKSVSETIFELSGVRPKTEPEKSELTQDKSLSEIVNRNYEERVKKQTFVLTSRPDLVDKFNWIIMRVRRIRGLTQKQLAEHISEPEAAIKLAEQGVVPEGYALLEKLQRFLKIKLIRERDAKMSSEPKTFSLDRKNLDNLTIADLKRMKEEKEAKREGNEGIK